MSLPFSWPRRLVFRHPNWLLIAAKGHFVDLFYLVCAWRFHNCWDLNFHCSSSLVLKQLWKRLDLHQRAGSYRSNLCSFVLLTKGNNEELWSDSPNVCLLYNCYYLQGWRMFWRSGWPWSTWDNCPWNKSLKVFVAVVIVHPYPQPSPWDSTLLPSGLSLSSCQV